MKNLIPFFLVLFMVGCYQEDDDTTPLAPMTEEIEKQEMNNISFEKGTGAIPDSWWQRVDGYNLAWTDECASSGERSVSIATEVPQPDFCFWAQTFTDFEYGIGLTLTAKVKTMDIEGGGCSLVIRGDDSIVPEGKAEYFATTQDIQYIGGTQDWTSYELNSEDPIPASIKSITIYLVYFAETIGTAYFDEVEIVPGEGGK